MDIPDEVTFKILEDVTEEHGYDDEALWCDGPFCDNRWTLIKCVTDGIEENVAQVRSNRRLHQEQILRSAKNKLAVVLTCKHWSVLGAELMYRTIVVRKRSSLVALLDTLDSKSERGSWIKGLFLYHDSRFGQCDLKQDDINQLLTRLIRYCPTLRALVFDPFTELCNAFWEKPELFDVIRTFTTLRFVSWYIIFGAKFSMANAFANKPNLSSLRLQNAFDLPNDFVDSDSSSIHLPSLETLSISNVTKLSLTYVSSWSMPNLISLDIDFGFDEDIDEDVKLLLRVCGAKLLTLNFRAYYNHSMDVQSFLFLCPNLTALSLDINRHLQEHIVPSPHQNLSRIGFHSRDTLFSFPEDETDPPFWRSHRREGPLRIKKLSNLSKVNFPRLSSIRIMSRLVVTHYLRRGRMEALDVAKSVAWTELYRRCAVEGIRLEDSTGREFGLPPFSGVPGPFVYVDDY